MKKKRKGLLVVLSSPSGGGKTTIAQKLLRKDKNILRSVSCTTREPRLGERNGRDYFFVTVSRFRGMIAKGAFWEWARVHGHLYGTPKPWVNTQLLSGKDVLLVIDVQGGKTLKRLFPSAVLIFLKPPRFSTLKKRLLGRHSENFSALKVRLKNALWEIKQGKGYDYQVVNDRLSKAVSDVAQVIRKERKRKGMLQEHS